MMFYYDDGITFIASLNVSLLFIKASVSQKQGAVAHKNCPIFMSTGDRNADQTYYRENPGRYDVGATFSGRAMSHLFTRRREILRLIYQRMITGTVPILAVWFFYMGASIKRSATSTVLRKSGTLVITKILVAWVVAAIASHILPEHGVGVGFFAGLSTPLQ
ncbi:2-keto-3-deoxygluconate permease [Salmonella enterica subsp. houtenae serovar Houten]|nr:2-keto-3-deoxygluconate permease [Salmonella enterica subsp. houtenae serovar Houten]